MTEFREANPDFEASAASHLLPVVPGSPLWQDDFDGFMQERAKLIADTLSGMAYRKPGDFVGAIQVVPEASSLNNRIDLLEVRIRDFVSDRLSEVAGSHYWRGAVPGDVRNYAEMRLQQHLDAHPYEDLADYPPGRARLDFCTVGHYRVIIETNWRQFSDLFGGEDQFRRHWSAFSDLRNALKHNREPSDIQVETGRAAIMWLERVLDRHEHEDPTQTDEGDESDE
jgi:hypothetical protein